ncbi:MAG: DNA-protecting protein DprA [Acidobacteria bacterium]|nr:DNA-protecting protein DprA [Acidobacteriota bacterium]
MTDVQGASRAGYSRQAMWVALGLAPQLGATRSRRLVEHFGSLDHVFRASLTELEAAGIAAASAQAIYRGDAMGRAEEELVRASAAGAFILTIDDSAYPSLLRQIYDPPVALFVRGALDALAQAAIAVVGTRHPTAYGLGMAERLGRDLAAHGLVICSGLARGIDAAAHRGAVHAKGRTVAVLGTGVDVIYPRENTRLAENILEIGGAIVSEFPLGTFAAPQNFPIRNRIISGMSLGVLVVEAGEYSGTRITARNALEQNRELFAVPGNVTNRNAWGPNTLIKQGAKLVATWEDVFEELPAGLRAQLAPAPESQGATSASLFEQAETLGEHEKQVFRLLRADEPRHIDKLVEELDGKLSPSEIFSALFELEFSGRIRQLPGKNYVRAM